MEEVSSLLLRVGVVGMGGDWNWDDVVGDAGEERWWGEGRGRLAPLHFVAYFT